MKKSGFIVLFIISISLSLEMVARFSLGNLWIINTTSDYSSVKWEYWWFYMFKKSQDLLPPIDSYNEVLGWRPKANIKNIKYGKSTVNISEEGIRGDRVYGLKKDPNIIRIAIFGDSFAFGDDVNDNDTFAKQLEYLMPGSEVMNFGVHGYGVDQMMLRLRLEGFAYSPNYVVIAFIEDDLNRTLLSFRDYMKPRFVLQNNSLLLASTPIMSPEAYYNKMRFRPALYGFYQLMRDRFLLNVNREDQITPLVSELFRNIANDVNNHNSTPIFLFLPVGADMISVSPSFGENVMVNFCRSTKTPCLSARPYLLNAYNNGVKFNFKEHYEAHTHAIIANGLLKDLSGVLLNGNEQTN